MPKNYRGIVAKGVVKHMKIGSADSTIGNLKLDLIVATSWLFNFPYFDIPFATRVFDKSFHVGRFPCSLGKGVVLIIVLPRRMAARLNRYIDKWFYRDYRTNGPECHLG